jgi:hypothetical protein
MGLEDLTNQPKDMFYIINYHTRILLKDMYMFLPKDENFRPRLFFSNTFQGLPPSKYFIPANTLTFYWPCAPKDSCLTRSFCLTHKNLHDAYDEFTSQAVTIVFVFGLFRKSGM